MGKLKGNFASGPTATRWCPEEATPRPVAPRARLRPRQTSATIADRSPITYRAPMGPARIGDLRLYLGDRHDAKDRSLLRSLKITAVLNCTPPRDESSTGCPNFFEKEPAMRYRRVPIFDTQAEDASGHFDGACDFIASRLHHGGVLVHCNRGVSRSATFVVAHLMTSAGSRSTGADGPRDAPAAPNDAFLAQLRALEARLDAARAADAKRTGAAPAPAPRAGPARPIARRPKASAAPRPERAAPAAPARPERAAPAAPARPERATGDGGRAAAGALVATGM
ncbi:polynucleotide 5'-hydroxyl-kinase [Aureococcus anophagefferens]|nr:polynucleotide 5'-hydroxyl-kinase [Aureococcus anophagefferens]